VKVKKSRAMILVIKTQEIKMGVASCIDATTTAVFITVTVSVLLLSYITYYHIGVPTTVIVIYSVIYYILL